MGGDEMKIVARRGHSTFLLQDGDDGIIVDVEDRIQYPPKPIRSILKQGYWKPKKSKPEWVEILMAMPKQDQQQKGDQPTQETKPKSLTTMAFEIVLAESRRMFASSQAKALNLPTRR